MGEPGNAEERRSFVGISTGMHGNSATLDEALASAAEKIVNSELVTPEKTVWFDLSGLEVEIGNQHVKTYKATLTEKGEGGGS